MKSINSKELKFRANMHGYNTNKTKAICANSKFELRNVTVGEVA